MKILAKIIYIILYSFFVVWISVYTIKSIIKHYNLMKKYHPNMSDDVLSDRIVENVKRDLEKFRRNLGIPDIPDRPSI